MWFYQFLDTYNLFIVIAISFILSLMTINQTDGTGERFVRNVCKLLELTDLFFLAFITDDLSYKTFASLTL